MTSALYDSPSSRLTSTSGGDRLPYGFPIMGRKRHRRDLGDSHHATDNRVGIADALSRVRHVEDEESKETDGSPWQLVEDDRQKRRKQHHHHHHDSGHPAIYLSPSMRLQSFVKISDLQNLVLYLLSDGVAPQWVAVRHHKNIKKVVVLMVPGLEASMFNGQLSLLNEPAKTDGVQDEASKDNGGQDSRDDLYTNPVNKVSRANSSPLSPDDYYPSKLDASKLPEPLEPLADIFTHIWPIKAPGDDKYSRIYSPVFAMLKSALPKTKEEQNTKGITPARSKHWKNVRTPANRYLATPEQMVENEYVMHPALYGSNADAMEASEKRKIRNQCANDGWVDTPVSTLEEGPVPQAEIQQGSVTEGRDIIAMDCEMCKTGDDCFELTRISLVGWDGSVLMDELVKPESAITDYLTPFSGITPVMLETVTTNLVEIQKRLLDIITAKTILVGHSLNVDLNALKLTHPFIIDTSILYPHPRGPPLKASLKWLVHKYLNREIQQNHGTTGHDSIEDARACLDLLKQKCERGPSWGMPDSNTEAIFDRLRRRPGYAPASSNSSTNESGRTSAVVDWGEPGRGHGARADVQIGCQSDMEVVEGVKKVLAGDAAEHEAKIQRGADFVWARLRDLEVTRGWTGNALAAENTRLEMPQNIDTDPNTADGPSPGLASAVSRAVARIRAIHAALTPCTALIVYSGTSDTRETFRLQAVQQQFKREYQVKKWDELTVRWTDAEEQALRKASKKAREGVGFITVK